MRIGRLHQRIRIFILHIRNQPLHNLFVVEKAAGNDADDRVGGDGDEHTHNASDIPGNEQHDENLQRMSLDAGGIDERLVDEIVH